MQLHQFQFEETKQFSSLFLDYINDKSELKELYSFSPTIENFEKAIEGRNFQDANRPVLVDALKKQYHCCSPGPKVTQNIDLLLQPNTFTITTGHQLNIFTGPLFFIYKIAAVINMAGKLKERYPAYNFVPVYWMASEDHDFEEINNFKLFGRKYTWETDQKGPVGRFDTQSISSILEQLPEKPGFCIDGYMKQVNLADATRYIVNHLFEKHGLVILDADDKTLKQIFKPVIKDDVFQSNAHHLANKTTSQLENDGYKSQIYPRPINFFYMEDGLRQRIEEVDGKYVVLNSKLSFSKDEITSTIDKYPERFSPNVVLRPVYQEMILPNLAYVGGPAEVVYWLQLKGVFDHFKVPFPILFPRLFVMIIAKSIMKKVDKLGFGVNELFEDFETLKKKLLYSNEDPAYFLTGYLKEVETAFEGIKEKANTLDKSLEGFVASEFKKVEKGIGNIEKRLKKAEEQKEEVKLNQLKGLLEKLFPGGNPQEREDNFLNFYINNTSFIDELITQLNPFSLKYNVLTEDV